MAGSSIEGSQPDLPERRILGRGEKAMTDTAAARDTLLERFAELKERHGWTDTSMLRLAALGIATVVEDDAVDRLDRTAAALKDDASWTDPLNTPMRFVIASMVVRRELDAATVVEGVRQTNEALKSRRLRKQGAHGWLGALLLTLQSEGRCAPPHRLDRFDEIYRTWKSDHRWLTGADDYPMAAVHAAHDEPVANLTRRIEDAYRELDRLGYRPGDPLQTASHILGFLPDEGVSIAVRFDAVAAALAKPKRRLREALYDEAALLAVLPGDPQDLGRKAVALADDLRQREGGSFLGRLLSSFSPELALSIAVGLMVALNTDDELSDAADTAVVSLAASALEAQQAAAVAAVVATTAATSAATTS
jgi:hypothetical protein